MKSIQVILVLWAKAFGYMYGFYEYSEYFGPTIYDSNGSFHGYNGLEPGSDSNDAIQTDRGIYFDGVSGCVTQHSDYWRDPTPLLPPLMITMWLLPLGDGPIVARIDTTNDRTVFEIQYSLNSKSLRFKVRLGATGYSVSYTLASSESWVYINFEIGEDRGNTLLKIHSDAAVVADSGSITDTYEEVSTNAHKTLIGSNKNNAFGNFFIYTAVFDQSSAPDHSLLFTQSCLNQCDFGIHDTYCSCTACPASGTCISTNPEPLQDASGVLCSVYDCREGCNTRGLCFACAESEWPVCSTTNIDLTNLCDSECASCTGPLSTDCKTCSDPSLTVSSATGECVCTNGYYWDGAACQSCHSDCTTCSQSDLCLTCTTVGAVPDANAGCVCPVGYFEKDTACMACHVHCSACSDTSLCDSCADPNALPAADVGCACTAGYYGDGFTCSVCHSDCSTCDEANACLTCSDTLAELNEAGQCMCSEHSFLVEDECVCKEGYTKEPDGCMQLTDSIAETTGLDTVGGIIVTAALGTAGVATMIFQNPTSLWGLLNTIDLLSLFPLQGVDMPDDLLGFFKQLGLLNYFLDINALMFPSVDNDSEIPTKWRQYGYFTSNFMFNTLEYSIMIVFLLFSLLLALCGLLLPRGCWFHTKSRVVLKQYRYNVFIRFYIQAYLGLALGSILSIQAVCNQQYAWTNCIGVCCGIFLICTPCFIGYRTYKHEKAGDIDQLSSWYSEFTSNNKLFSYSYYTYFCVRRLCFVLILFFFGEFPALQISLNIGLSLTHMLLLWKLFRFARRIQQIEGIIVEVSILIVFSLMFCFLGDESLHASATYTIMSLSTLCIGIYYVDIIATVCVKCMSKLRNPNKRDEQSIHVFTRVKAMQNYRVNDEESKEEDKELHFPQLSVFTSRPNSRILADPNLTGLPSMHPHTCA